MHPHYVLLTILSLVYLSNRMTPEHLASYFETLLKINPLSYTLYKTKNFTVQFFCFLLNEPESFSLIPLEHKKKILSCLFFLCFFIKKKFELLAQMYDCIFFSFLIEAVFIFLLSVKSIILFSLKRHWESNVSLMHAIFVDAFEKKKEKIESNIKERNFIECTFI